jgi:hypothetical protein
VFCNVFSCLFMCFSYAFFLCLSFLWLASKLSCYEFQKASRVHKSAAANLSTHTRHTWTKKVQVRAKPWFSTKAPRDDHKKWRKIAKKKQFQPT